MNSWIRSKSKAVWIVGGGLLIVLAILWLAPKSSKPSTAKPSAPDAVTAPNAEIATAEGHSTETTETTVLPAAEAEESAAQAFLRRVDEATNPRNIAARNTARKENLEEIKARINVEVLAETGVDLGFDNPLTLEERLQKQLQMSREEWEEHQKKPDRSGEAMMLMLVKTFELMRPHVPESGKEAFEEELKLMREDMKESQRQWEELRARGKRLDEELTSWMTPAQKEQLAQEEERRRKAQLKEAIEILRQGGKPPWEEAAEAFRAGKTPKLPINPPSAH